MGVTRLGKTDNRTKKTLLQYILNPTNSKEYNYITHKQTAKFLCDLSLKKWPDNENKSPKEKIEEDDIIKIHLTSLIETLLVLPKQTHVSPKNEHFPQDLDLEVLEILTMVIENFLLEIPETTETLIGVLVLLTNILSYLVDYEIIDGNNVENSRFVALIKTIIQKDDIKYLRCYRKERELIKLLDCINNLNILFSDLSINKHIVLLIRNLIPTELLKSLLILLTEIKGTY